MVTLSRHIGIQACKIAAASAAVIFTAYAALADGVPRGALFDAQLMLQAEKSGPTLHRLICRSSGGDSLTLAIDNENYDIDILAEPKFNFLFRNERLLKDSGFPAGSRCATYVRLEGSVYAWGFRCTDGDEGMRFDTQSGSLSNAMPKFDGRNFDQNYSCAPESSAP